MVKLYYAALKPGEPTAGLGLYDPSGRCRYYSAGGAFFYDMGTGVAVGSLTPERVRWIEGELKAGRSVPCVSEVIFSR
jgi:hypothetical protein